MEPLIKVENLKIAFPGQEVVRGISFELYAGEMLALVGESGSGKSLLCRALLGLLPKGAVASFARLIRPAPEAMSLVMQDAMTALDPAMPVGKQIAEAQRRHPPDPVELLSRVGVEEASSRAKQYPGEFSGGMRQRAAIAVALAMQPQVIFADEPTTALDSDKRIQIMRLLGQICRDQTAVLFVTHDLSLVRDHADRVLIMKDGQIIEGGTTAEIFTNPREGYTQELIRYAALGDPANHTHGRLHYHDRAMHSHEHTGWHRHEKAAGGNADIQELFITSNGNANRQESPMESTGNVDRQEPLTESNGNADRQEPLIQAKALSKYYPLTDGKVNRVLKGVNLAIYPGEIAGLTGPSGIGKSTLARCVAGLEKPSAGQCFARKGLNIQMIFQDSVSALNPRMTVERLIGEPLYLRDSKHPSREIIFDLMRQTELAPDLLGRRPHELSGGQRQRVAIARAIATRPDLIIADEPVSSLDVTTRSKIIHLLKRLKDEHNLTLLLISHDLYLLAHVSDRIIRL